MNIAWRKNQRREIRHTLGRYLAILAIIALGVGFFAGLKVTQSAMIKTGDVYIADCRMFDYRLISTLGLTNEDVAYFSGLDGVAYAEGAVSIDFITTGEDKTEQALRAHSITENINTLSVTAGRMPSAANECVADALYYTQDDIGKTITVSQSNDKDTLDQFKYTEYTIVGLANSVCYLNLERGTTNLAGGSLSGFVYIPEDGFSFDCYTEAYVTLSSGGEIFSEEYEAAVSEMEQPITDALEERADIRYQGIIDDANEKVADAQAQYDTSLSDYEAQKTDVQAQLAESKETLGNSEGALAAQEAQLSEQELSVTSVISQLEAGIADIDAKLSDPLYAPYYDALTAQKAALEAQLAQARAGLETLNQSKIQLAQAKAKLEQGWTNYDAAKAEAEETLANAQDELAAAKEKIEDAKADILKIEPPACYTLDRTMNTGYACFENDSAVVDGIAKVFPIFFFLVAALVCTTTMTRMVEEQRTQIGTLKALGYSNAIIVWKYISYSGSAAVIGCIIGFMGGSKLFPWAIWQAYRLLYGFAKIEFVFDGTLAVLSLTVALLCSVGATYAACRTELYKMPAELMRPKAPKAGKRVLLERIPFIWKHVSFLHKVSIRNILRYKKRLIMMVLGISGCTALVLTGFGIRDSISNIAADQFDSILKYDYNVSFTRAKTAEEMDAFVSDTSGVLSQCVFVCNDTLEAVCEDGTKSVNIVATDDSGITDLVDLHYGEEGIAYPPFGNVVISEKLAKFAKVSVGDEITVKLNDTETGTFKVSGIFENYVHHYMYMTAQTYEAVLGKECVYKNALARTDFEDVHTVSAQLINDYGAASVSITSDIRARVENMMKSLNSIVILVIASAGALAFVVLFNLSNINITERVREIATIKVLGFYPSQVGAYVFRENIVLTAIGALVGLPLGVWLHRFVMSQIQIDMVNFKVEILPKSFLFALAITFAFTFSVDLLMRIKLEKINMAESLKSVE